MKTDRDSEVLIVGAGLAGLACARHLQRGGVGCRILDRAGAVGGRVRTDRLDGFQLDRGFQVYLTAYPAGRRELDYASLRLQQFTDGALVRKEGRFHRLADPLRHPSAVLSTLTAPIGNPLDKLRVLGLRRRLTKTTVERILGRPATSTETALRERWGFSESMIDDFFRPFIGGVTLDRSLETSSRSFEFVIRMFSEGHAAVPALGMQAIPEQIAASLDPGTIELNAPVAEVGPGPRITLTDGRRWEGRAVVVATGQQEAVGLLDALPSRQLPADGTNGVTCLYFAAERAPVDEATLVLNS
ncbi:MAG: FAD-dependent oxidoreductase, partial [Gemmatimonadota bacterium]|nr:FAD-dependent oxidoreductase [Gemmatimonadota bacterium]